jgi:SAM-dependent methyltransferase
MERFGGHYDDWRRVRIQKIESIFSKEYFKDKTILELGCGYGDIGMHFVQLGAQVTFAEGRQEHIDVFKQRYPDIEIIQLNQEYPWNLNKKFDIIIHWGVLYHLDKWQQDLSCAAKHTNLMFLETEVCDSDDEDIDLKVEPSDRYDQEIGRFASKPSANNVEKNLKQLGYKFTRYDDSDLNSGFHEYNWEVKNTELWRNGLRRFWVVKK